MIYIIIELYVLLNNNTCDLFMSVTIVYADLQKSATLIFGIISKCLIAFNQYHFENTKEDLFTFLSLIIIYFYCVNCKLYVSYKNEQLIIEASQPSSVVIPRAYRHREPINVFGRPFVNAVFDSLHTKKITLAKASTYLDNIKIKDVRQLEQYV